MRGVWVGRRENSFSVAYRSNDVLGLLVWDISHCLSFCTFHIYTIARKTRKIDLHRNLEMHQFSFQNEAKISKFSMEHMKICPMYHTIFIWGQSSHPEIRRQQVSMENFVGLPIQFIYWAPRGGYVSCNRTVTGYKYSCQHTLSIF